MCLNTIRPNLKKEISKLKVHSDGYIWLWKVFGVKSDNALSGCCRNFVFYEGKNTARGGKITNGAFTYPAGFHCYISKKAAEENWCGHVQQVKVRKSWITSIGLQWGTVVVCKHIII